LTDNPYASPHSQADGDSAESGSSSLRLVFVLSATAAGCLLAFVSGVWLSAYFNSDVPAILAATMLPTFGAMVGGVRNRRQLLKVAMFALIGWLLGYTLQPAISGRHNADIPSIIENWVATAFVPSSLLALIGASFAVRSARTQ